MDTEARPLGKSEKDKVDRGASRDITTGWFLTAPTHDSTSHPGGSSAGSSVDFSILRDMNRSSYCTTFHDIEAGIHDRATQKL